MNDAPKRGKSAKPEPGPSDVEQAGLGLGGDAPAASYRVLARKYRPSTFDDLIGQEAMVRTISNAFETGRIPQAWILSGVRGVGKTTTARILARALNYELPDGSVKGPTIAMPTLGLHCQPIMESRHIDVIEMDAASHNGVDDVRQINDAIRYAPVSARYKVYILDEVHMLSTAAFNALLKTLEEPPPHAKFIFATTEIRDVPVTVLSRCQRFDLRRVDAAMLVTHLAGIAEKENIGAETEALALIARAAEGSVRDALSLLDQAIAHAAGTIRAQDVRTMLGLADRTRVIDLFESLMKGDVAAALKELREQYDIGADPLVVLADIAEFTHFVTRIKIVPAVADDISLGEAERTRGRALAATLSMRVLSRTWQMLLKGMSEVQAANRPLAAAEMLLVRIAYVADLPTPDEVIRSLDDGGGVGSGAVFGATSQPQRQCGAQRPAGANAMRAGRSAPRFDAAARRRSARDGGAIRARRAARTASAKLSGSRDQQLRRARGAGERQARHPDQARAGARRAAGSLRGRHARNRARAGRRQDAGQRSVAQASALDRPVVDGGDLARARRADAEIGGGCPQGRARGRRARRSAGQGGAGTIPRRRDCRRAWRQGRSPGAARHRRTGHSAARRHGFGDNWAAATTGSATR